MENIRTQTDVTQTVLNFLGDYKINNPDDLILLIKHINDSLEFRNYNDKTRQHADSIQWKRTVSEILQDGYVYDGKACSDLCMILVALSKAVGLEAQLCKLIRVDGKNSHSIVEIKINNEWYRIDPTFTKPIPFKGYLTKHQIWNKNWEGGWKVWKRGPDLWSMGIHDINDESKIT
ncbi:MAG: transglutaminase domain-containing protein [Patescibacteria group bacterium]|jgi:hypothetical protein|nr:transglutaminase domain-containing protein [Patescibacteria group bacterium]